MIMPKKWFIISMLSMLLVNMSLCSAESVNKKTVAVQASMVIDIAGNEPITDAVILIEDGRIKAVGKESEISVPVGSEVIDARGKTVIPGLIDAHVHYNSWMNELFLSHGITTVRDVGSNLEYILQQRTEHNRPGYIGPRIFTSGPLIDGPNPFWVPKYPFR